MSVVANRPQVSVIIVTWNCREHVLRCLATLMENRDVSFEIIVRDNGSTDGTPTAIRRAYSDVRLVGDGSNVGFAAGNNEAIRYAQGDYLLLLNPDTEVQSDTLANLTSLAEKHKNRAIVAPRLLNSDGTIQPSANWFPTFGSIPRRIKSFGASLLEKNQKHEERSMDWAIGACLFIPAAVHQVVGPLDANIFMYGEDLDYCWRAQRAGFKVILAFRIKVVHHGNVSGARYWKGGRAIKISQGRIYFWLKHFGPLYTIGVALFQALFFLARAGWHFLGGVMKRAPSEFSKGREALQISTVLLRTLIQRKTWVGLLTKNYKVDNKIA